MEIAVSVTEGRIETAFPCAEGAGARVEFIGVVRGTEGGKKILALRYEAYCPMAENQMRKILEGLGREHPFLRARVIHRVGAVPVGEAAIHVCVEAVHRAEAFAVATAFMDRLKRDVPIWKRGGVS